MRCVGGENWVEEFSDGFVARKKIVGRERVANARVYRVQNIA
jgi:hypothetical protein